MNVFFKCSWPCKWFEHVGGRFLPISSQGEAFLHCFSVSEARLNIPSAHHKQCTNTVELCAGNFSLATCCGGFLGIDCQLFQAFEHTSKEFTCNINWQLWLF